MESNRLFKREQLANRYWIMRHGHSEANKQSLIVSWPEHGINDYGLSELGREQVVDSLNQCGLPGREIQIISSDFKRARETAEMARHVLGCTAAIVFDQRLRERNFGEFELQSNDHYLEVWAWDAIHPEQSFQGCESTVAVTQRISHLIDELERTSSRHNYLLVSHGDALQILQCAFQKMDPARHRDIEHIETAEIRAPTWI